MQQYWESEQGNYFCLRPTKESLLGLVATPPAFESFGKTPGHGFCWGGRGKPGPGVALEITQNGEMGIDPVFGREQTDQKGFLLGAGGHLGMSGGIKLHWRFFPGGCWWCSVCQGLFKDTAEEIQIQFKHTTKEIPAGSSSMIQRELCRRMSGPGWDAGGTKKECL